MTCKAAILQTIVQDDMGLYTQVLTGTTELAKLPTFTKYAVYDTEVCGLEVTYFNKTYKPSRTGILPRNWTLE